MKLVLLLILNFALCTFASEPLLQRGAVTLSPFVSDGCSVSPDGSRENATLLYECCERHDVWYWMGGTALERLYADRELALCITKKANAGVALVYYWGVRLGGGPKQLTSYRWGFGWSHLQPYLKLSPEETQLRQTQLRALKYKGSILP